MKLQVHQNGSYVTRNIVEAFWRGGLPGCRRLLSVCGVEVLPGGIALQAAGLEATVVGRERKRRADWGGSGDST